MQPACPGRIPTWPTCGPLNSCMGDEMTLVHSPTALHLRAWPPVLRRLFPDLPCAPCQHRSKLEVGWGPVRRSSRVPSPQRWCLHFDVWVTNDSVFSLGYRTQRVRHAHIMKGLASFVLPMLQLHCGCKTLRVHQTSWKSSLQPPCLILQEARTHIGEFRTRFEHTSHFHPGHISMLYHMDTVDLHTPLHH